MDADWFKAVNRKLTELEGEKAQRFTLAKGAIDKQLHQHPTISSSCYWHNSDRFVPSSSFDWTTPRFPTHYLRYITREDASMIEHLATQPYTMGNDDSAKIENQKILIARILMLKANHLLPDPT